MLYILIITAILSLAATKQVSAASTDVSVSTNTQSVSSSTSSSSSHSHIEIDVNGVKKVIDSSDPNVKVEVNSTNGHTEIKVNGETQAPTAPTGVEKRVSPTSSSSANSSTSSSNNSTKGVELSLSSLFSQIANFLSQLFK